LRNVRPRWRAITATDCATVGPQLTNPQRHEVRWDDHNCLLGARACVLICGSSCLRPSPHSSGRGFGPRRAGGTLQLSTRCSSLALPPSRSLAVRVGSAWIWFAWPPRAMPATSELRVSSPSVEPELAPSLKTTSAAPSSSSRVTAADFNSSNSKGECEQSPASNRPRERPAPCRGRGR
jgi:hypothetical protein